MTLCKALTKEGNPCKNFVGKGKKVYCSRHSGKTIKQASQTSTTKPTPKIKSCNSVQANRLGGVQLTGTPRKFMQKGG